MKRFIPVLLTLFIQILISCGKSGEPAPVPPPVVVVPPVVPPVTPPSGGTGGTSPVTPQNDLYLTSSDQTNLNAALAFTSSKYTIYNLSASTTSATSYSTGGSIKGELRNLTQGTVPSQGDDYTRGYQPANILPKGQAAVIADTASKVCMKFTDPSAKNINGQPIIKWLFLYNSGGAGAGELGIVSAGKMGVFTGADLTKLYTRNDYKAQ